MKKIKATQKRGITLIALIITIVILIILAAITLNALLGENGVINKAQEAKETYENSSIKEQDSLNKMLNEYHSIIKNKNNIKFLKQGYCSERGTNYINLSVIAEGNEKAELIYTLNWGEKFEKADTVIGISGEEVTFHITNLKDDTNYNWRIDVSDGEQTIKGKEGSMNTYCATTKCEGPFQETTNCSVCKGSGKVTVACTGTLSANRTETSKPSHIPCAGCYASGNNYRYTVRLYCSIHGEIASYNDVFLCSYYCARTYAVRQIGGKCNRSSTSTCTNCKGVGSFTNDILCEHGLSSVHWFCKHGINEPENYHP